MITLTDKTTTKIMNTTTPTEFTEEQIIEWLGDPDWSYSGIVETFMDLANGDYTIENMRKDILNDKN